MEKSAVSTSTCFFLRFFRLKGKICWLFTFILYDGGAQSIFRHSFDLSKKNNQVQKVNRQANKIYKFKEPLAVNGRYPLTWNFVSDVILLPNRVLLPHVEWRGNNVVSRWNKMEFLISALSRLCTWAGWWQQEISKFFTNSFSPPDPGAPAASKFDFLQTHILTSDTFANTKCLEIT